MSTTTYEEIRAAVHRLPPKEQDQLLTDLQAARHTLTSADVQQTRVALDGLKALSQRIGAAWQGEQDAVAAVREQRREL